MPVRQQLLPTPICSSVASMPRLARQAPREPPSDTFTYRLWRRKMLKHSRIRGVFSWEERWGNGSFSPLLFPESCRTWCACGWAGAGRTIARPYSSSVRFEPVHGDAHVRATIELVQNLSSASTAQGAFEAFMSRLLSLRPVDHFVGDVPVSVEEGSYRMLYHVSRELVQGGAAFPRRNFEARDLEALPVQREGLVSRLIQTPAPQLVCYADLSDDAGLKAIAEEAKTVMALPLYAGERVVEWVLGLSKLSQGIGAPDVQQAVMTSNFMEMTNAHLLSLEEISRLNRLLTNQFEEVAKIQQPLLPAR